MKTWTSDIEIKAPIEQVFKYFSGSLEEMQKIMPKVIDQQPIKVTEEYVGSVYRQKYKEGKRVEEYDVKTLEYLNEADHKQLKIGFNLSNIFEITAAYEFKNLDENKTYLKYTTSNRPLKWFVKIFLFFASDKVVVEFLERVKQVAETEAKEIE